MQRSCHQLMHLHVSKLVDIYAVTSSVFETDVSGWTVKGFMPKQKYTLKVIAVYRDKRTTEHSIEYDHASMFKIHITP